VQRYRLFQKLQDIGRFFSKVFCNEYANKLKYNRLRHKKTSGRKSGMQYALPYLIIRVREGSGNGKERQQNASENAAVHTGKHNRDNKKAQHKCDG